MAREKKLITPEQKHARFIGNLWGWGAAALIMWAMSQPLLLYAPAADIALLGWEIGLVVIIASQAAHAAGRPLLVFIIAAVLLGGYTFWDAWKLLGTAMETSIANEARCSVIENDLLSARPVNPNAIDRFQALGCSPKSKKDLFVGPYMHNSAGWM